MYTFAHTICTLHAHIQETKHRVKCYKLDSHNANPTKKIVLIPRKSFKKLLEVGSKMCI